MKVNITISLSNSSYDLFVDHIKDILRPILNNSEEGLSRAILLMDLTDSSGFFVHLDDAKELLEKLGKEGYLVDRPRTAKPPFHYNVTTRESHGHYGLFVDIDDHNGRLHFWSL